MKKACAAIMLLGAPLIVNLTRCTSERPEAREYADPITGQTSVVETNTIAFIMIFRSGKPVMSADALDGRAVIVHDADNSALPAVSIHDNNRDGRFDRFEYGDKNYLTKDHNFDGW